MFFFLIFNFFVKPEEDWLSSMGYSSLKRGVFFFFFFRHREADNPWLSEGRKKRANHITDRE